MTVLMRVLAVVAHPDDEALGCGGALAKLTDDGHEAIVLLPTRRNDARGRDCWGELVGAFEQSCRLLGARPVILDPLLDETEATSQVHELQNRILPLVEDADFVFTHWPHDANQVHRGIARAVEIATRPFRRRRDVSLFEVPTSTDQTFGGTGAAAFTPTEYVVLSAEQACRKCEAVAAYATELAPGRTPTDIDRRLRFRGAEIGVDFAEAFVVARRFR